MDTVKLDQQLARFRGYHTPEKIDADKALKQYPLMEHVNYISDRGAANDHLHLYLNAAYAARSNA